MRERLNMPNVKQRGFTLVELLVAITVMALMTAFSWRGLDGIINAWTRLESRGNEVQILQTTLTQYETDLDALALQPDQASVDWDGRVLRILRSGTRQGSGEGLYVVAWAQKTVAGQGRWVRWKSEELRTREQMRAAWIAALSWAQNNVASDHAHENVTIAMSKANFYFYRNNAWTNPMSSVGTTSNKESTNTTVPPDAVRVVLDIQNGSAISGVVTRDWLRNTAASN